MKKNLKLKISFLLMIAVVMISIISCQKDEVYSCNPQINRWAKSNIAEIKSMNVEDFSKFDESQKRAVYRIYTQEQKYLLWKMKLQNALTLDWNVDEANHINKLIAYIESYKETIFNKDNEESFIDDFEKFQYEWVEYAEDNLKWSKQTIASIAYTANKLLTKDGSIEIVNKKTESVAPRETPLRSCDCAYGETITCLDYNHTCKDDPCKETSPGITDGCGFLLLSPCTGLCEFGS